MHAGLGRQRQGLCKGGLNYARLDINDGHRQAALLRGYVAVEEALEHVSLQEAPAEHEERDARVHEAHRAPSQPRILQHAPGHCTFIFMGCHAKTFR